MCWDYMVLDSFIRFLVLFLVAAALVSWLLQSPIPQVAPHRCWGDLEATGEAMCTSAAMECDRRSPTFVYVNSAWWKEAASAASGKGRTDPSSHTTT